VTRCLVTDRRRLCPHAISFAVQRRCLMDQARRAVDSHVDLIHVRERDLDAAALVALVTDILSLTRGTSTRVVINDRLDVAVACGADGVHLRGDSIPVAAARRLAPRPFLIGRSIHSVVEAPGAVGADYVIAGTVFPTASKADGAPLIGIEGLSAIVRAATVPVLAIGGVTAARMEAVRATGAAGIAAVGLFIDSLKPTS
jgi:thiamine-phosphate pyrophosphorylase